MRVSRDTPLSELTIRRYEKPGSLAGRELIRKLCLCLGLLQPGDSRDVIVDLLLVMLQAKKMKKLMGCTEIEHKVISCRERHKLQLLGVASPNIRRQLKRLKDLMIVEKVEGGYRIAEFLPLAEIFTNKIEPFLYDPAKQRLLEYLQRTDDEFTKSVGKQDPA